MRTRFCVFTFGRDAEIALVLCEYLAANKMGEVVIIDDGANPFSEEERKRVAATGAAYEVSSWKRGGNLNGKVAIMGILSDLYRHSSGVDWVVKLDADTLPQDSFLAELGKTDKDVVCCGYGTREFPMLGACYAMRRHAIPLAQYSVSVKVTDEQSAPEDKTLGPLLLGCGLSIRSCSLGYQDYHFHGLYLKNMPSFAVCFGFITDIAGKPQRTKDQYGNFVAGKMREFIRLSSATVVPGTLTHTKKPE